MAIQFLDPGGEFYYSLGVGAPGVWDNATSGVSLVNNAPAGAATSYAISHDGNPAHSVTKNLSNFATLIAGYRTYVGSGVFTGAIITFFDNGTSQCDLRVSATGHLYFTRNGTQLGSQSTNALAGSSGWHYIEFKATIASGTSGSLEARVDGVVWLTVSGVNTQNSANAYANQVSFAGASQSSLMRDFYILDTGTGANTSYLGDITVGVYYPNGAGANTQWTPNGAVSNYQCVQDGIAHSGTWPDGDTTYVADATAGNQDDYAHQAASFTGTIFGVVHRSYLRKDDAGSRSVEQYCKSGTVYSYAATYSMGATFNYVQQILETDPNTAAQWTVTGFNAATFGVKVIS